jgi:hypothetical protein
MLAAASLILLLKLDMVDVEVIPASADFIICFCSVDEIVNSEFNDAWALAVTGINKNTRIV